MLPMWITVLDLSCNPVLCWRRYILQHKGSMYNLLLNEEVTKQNGVEQMLKINFKKIVFVKYYFGFLRLGKVSDEKDVFVALRG